MLKYISSISNIIRHSNANKLTGLSIGKSLQRYILISQATSFSTSCRLFNTKKYSLTNQNQKVNSQSQDGTTKPAATESNKPEYHMKEENDDADDAEDNGYLTTIFDGKEPYLDTYEVYKQLINAGFNESQANSFINFLIAQINKKVSKLTDKFSQIYELENERYLFESAQQELRVDVTRSREQYINELIALIHILERDFRVISDELNNDFIQMKNDSQVSINEQKSENTLHSKKIKLNIQEANHKITTELISLMRSEIETLRWNISRWGIQAILVTVFSGVAIYYVYRAKVVRRKNEREFVPLVIFEPSELDEDDYHTDLDRTSIS